MAGKKHVLDIDNGTEMISDSNTHIAYARGPMFSREMDEQSVVLRYRY
jgi:hypothetical protein